MAVMTQLLYHGDAWVIALGLLVLMIAAWLIGLATGGRLSRLGDAVSGNRVAEPSLALMGLLLAFTFAMALDKHSKRREMIVQDANAVGDFYTTASLLKEPVRGVLQAVIRDYARDRLELARHPVLNEAELDAAIARINTMHAQMTERVHEAVDTGTPVAVPLVNTLNNLTSSHAARLDTVRDRLPGPIVLLLAICTLISMALLGREQGVAGKRHYISSLGLMLMISFALYLTLDLNQPRRGLVRLSQEPLERLVKAMEQ
jgi:hypothetical protein